MRADSVTFRLSILPDPERGEGAPMAAFEDLDRGGGLGVIQVGGRLVTSRLRVGRDYEVTLRDVTGRPAVRPAEAVLDCIFSGEQPRSPGALYAILCPPGDTDPADEIRLEGELLARHLRANRRYAITITDLGDV